MMLCMQCKVLIWRTNELLLNLRARFHGHSFLYAKIRVFCVGEESDNLCPATDHVFCRSPLYVDELKEVCSLSGNRARTSVRCLTPLDAMSFRCIQGMRPICLTIMIIGELQPFPSIRAVRIMEQRYFEQRAMLGGMAPGAGLFDGYRKGKTINV